MDSNNISTSSTKERIKKISTEKITTINKSMEMKSSKPINLAENQNNNINKNNLSIYSFINEMPFENLNDYYDIESSLFLKRIEKLNLKFYWTSECVLNQQDIKYPYNKLFLILFKQISLYIDEISRLNKQLKQKLKNEKFYQIKLAKMKEKENEYILNKQMLKNLQRDNKLLIKNNDKIKNENEKLNKKLANSYKAMTGNNTSINSLYRNKNKDKNYFYITPRFSNTSMGYDSVITQESVLSKRTNRQSDLSDERKNKYILNVSVKNRNKNKNKSFSNSIERVNNQKKDNNNKNNKEIINNGINFCDEELENLEMIEDILKKIKNKNNSKFKKEKNNVLDITNYKTNNSIKINNYLKNNKRNKIYPYKTTTKVKKIFH